MYFHFGRVLGGEGSMTMTRMPFLVERAIVTVLRACIHMLDREDEVTVSSPAFFPAVQ